MADPARTVATVANFADFGLKAVLMEDNVSLRSCTLGVLRFHP
jgi:hypothetical protein